jgi:hypothetical protein
MAAMMGALDTVCAVQRLQSLFVQVQHLHAHCPLEQGRRITIVGQRGALFGAYGQI